MSRTRDLGIGSLTADVGLFDTSRFVGDAYLNPQGNRRYKGGYLSKSSVVLGEWASPSGCCTRNCDASDTQ